MWQLIKIKPSNTKLVIEEMEEFYDLDELEFGGDGEEFSDFLQVGDNLVVPTIEGNAKGMDFYSYNVNIKNSWSVSLSHVFGVVNLTRVIMLWLGPITKNEGEAINHMCVFRPLWHNIHRCPFGQSY